MQELSPKQQLLARSFAEKLAMNAYLQGFPSNWSFDQVIDAVINETGDVGVWPQFEDMAPSDVVREIVDIVPIFESHHRTLLEANNAEMFSVKDDKLFGIEVRQAIGATNQIVAYLENKGGQVRLYAEIAGATIEEARQNLQDKVKALILG